jgi:hypothetical protein
MKLVGQVIGMIGLSIEYFYKNYGCYVRIVKYVVKAKYRNNCLPSLL